jgi:CheY-like chemotaxis protein
MEPAHVLVVEDDPKSLILLTHILRGGDYDVQTAVNGREALTILEWFAADVILLDINLPDIQGLPLARRIKDDLRTRHIPIIAVTANAMRDDEAAGIAAGVDAYLTKPIDRAYLLEVLHQQVRRIGLRKARGESEVGRGGH